MTVDPLDMACPECGAARGEHCTYTDAWYRGETRTAPCGPRIVALGADTPATQEADE